MESAPIYSGWLLYSKVHQFKSSKIKNAKCWSRQWVLIRNSTLWILNNKNDYQKITNFIELKSCQIESHSADSFTILTDKQEAYAFKTTDGQSAEKWIMHITNTMDGQLLDVDTFVQTEADIPCASGFKCTKIGEAEYENFCAECYKTIYPKLTVINGYIREIENNVIHKPIPQSINSVCFKFYNSELCKTKCGKYVFGDPKLNNYCAQCFVDIITKTAIITESLLMVDGDKKVMVVLCASHFISLFDENEFKNEKYCNPAAIIDLNLYSSIKSIVSHPFGFVLTSKDGHTYTFITKSEVDKSNWLRLIGRSIVEAQILRSAVDESDEQSIDDQADVLFDDEEVATSNQAQMKMFDNICDEHPLNVKKTKKKKVIKGIFDDDDDGSEMDIFGTKSSTIKESNTKNANDPFDDSSDDSDWMNTIRKKAN